MKIAAGFLSMLMLAASVVAAPLLDEPVAQLPLKSGRVLFEARAKSFASKVVGVRHRDGIEMIPYSDFPDEYQAALLQKRPTPSATPPAAANPAPATRPKAANRAPAAAGSVLTIVSSNIGQVATEVSFRNDSDQSLHLAPQVVAAETSDGKMVQGRHWVTVGSDGRITGNLSPDQVLGAHESVTLAVVFERLPEGITLKRVGFVQPPSPAGS
jgi:hypothetical protein